MNGNTTRATTTAELTGLRGDVAALRARVQSLEADQQAALAHVLERLAALEGGAHRDRP